MCRTLNFVPCPKAASHEHRANSRTMQPEESSYIILHKQGLEIIEKKRKCEQLFLSKL